MKEQKRCAICNHEFDKSTMHYRPEVSRGFTKEWFYCDACNEKRLKLLNLKSAKTAFNNQRRNNFNRSSIRRSHY
ncbi:hypothetical protein [Lelliottia nimipressuralis]|jgi:hypothetical protein|uniref:HNH endonuclease n=1 Tax=Lelliottia nimipressuralis TaxID=69220 RepID=A0ABY3P6L5_9ENTR|nr:hypothetical protein [Lelliottia nimipressuralis]RXJ10467.1 hypothetical protein ETG88_20110 [Lelliottia nimipressuralis]TYT34964.1 hypothetical protein FZO59_04840 [Lelliottia nimipressuralis]